MPLLFHTHTTPDLGCFVRRKHGVEGSDDFRNVHVDLSPSIDFAPLFHQVYVRVVCGHAAFFQRCLVYLRTDLSIPGPILEAFPPDLVLGGDFRPHPSDWQHFPVQRGERFYFFLGQHRDPATSQWRADASTVHSYDIYERGTLSTVHFDDTGGDLDHDDLVIEVAVVGRSPWEDLTQAIDQVPILEAFDDWSPRLRARMATGDAAS